VATGAAALGGTLVQDQVLIGIAGWLRVPRHPATAPAGFGDMALSYSHIRPAVRSGKRLLYLAHRWLGIVTCLLCVMWFVSGLVMLYVPFPAWTQQERLATLPAIDGRAIAVTPDEAVAASGLKTKPSSVRIEMYGDEPVYRLAARDAQAAVSAVDRRVIRRVTVEDAKQRLAAVYPGSAISYVGPVERDQWTVTRRFDPHRPLYLFALNDAADSKIYVSSQTGEIVQNSTQSERFWNWLGAIPHWIYFTPIRKDQELWRQAVMWASGPVIIGAIAGLWIGLLRIRPRRRYARGAMTPYKGWMKWHHVGGLVGGLFLTTWIFSGWLSVNPFHWFARTAVSPAQLERYASPRDQYGIGLEALKAASETPAREISTTFFRGRALIIARNGEERAVFDGATAAPIELSEDDLVAAGRALYPGHEIVSHKLLTEDDLYWYSHHTARVLPVLRLVFNDPAATWVHIDPVTGQVLNISDESARYRRWLFNFLHDFDLPVLLQNRPLRDILIWLLSAAGLVISVSGVVIAWRHLSKVSARRALRRQARLASE
jgi:uncharacterized iron-regulated membrane protein